ncbi:MAG: beta-N-acetylglucosaminidase [Marinifilaceae bacterium]
MSTKQLFLLPFLLIMAHVTMAQEIVLQPNVQQISIQSGNVSLANGYQLKSGNLPAPILKALAEAIGEAQAKSTLTVYAGKKGDAGVRAYSKFIPKKAEGYYIKVTDKSVVVAGADERGLFYGMQTLAQLVEGNSLPKVEITDYPDIRFRGVVEGFYGTPWSHEARISQLKYYGLHKMNTYIYGPKDDPYHSSPNWRKPYPANEAKQLQELVNIAHDNYVDFVWAIHPGKDIKWNQEDRDNLLAKFEAMYQLGLRSFAVFFDDISGEGTNPDRQAELLNYIDDNFVKVKKDVTPLVMCPTEYNKSWSNPNGGYLTTLGDKLNPSVEIMWTGDRVIATIDKQGTAWINERIKRPAYIWWNFPVSDYVRDHLLMGEVYGNDLNLQNDLSGFVSNPMEHAEASKIALYSVADYAWNMAKFESRSSWERAIAHVLPKDADALKCFAEHNSDLGENGHRFRRDESKELTELIDRFNQSVASGTYNQADYDRLMNEFEMITESASRLMVNKENPALIQEMMPWLIQFELLGKTGKCALELLKAQKDGDNATFLSKYNYLQTLRERSFVADQSYNQNPYQPGVKCGTLRLLPAINNMFVASTSRYNSVNSANLDLTVAYAPHKVISNVEQMQFVPLRIKRNQIIVSPMLEVVKWDSEAQFTLQLDKTYQGKNLEFNFGKQDIGNWSRIEVSTDGAKWDAVEFTQKDNKVNVKLNDAPVQAVRVVNKSDKQQEIYLRSFILTIGNEVAM